MSDVPEGYKMSEVGVIPEEWEVKTLGEVLKVKHGKSQHEISDDNGIFPILATGGVIGRTNIFLYDEPSVLIGRKGTIDVPQYMETPFWTIDTLFYTEIFKNTFPKFIFYKFNTIDWYSFNEASGVPSLNANTIEKIQIPLPPLPEQQAIASALSDVDAFITALEQLITKKRNIKQGAMQQLLTGKKRLPGFSGEWEVKKLGEIAEVRGRVGWKGYTKADMRPNGPLAIGAKHIDDSNRLCLNEPTHLSYEKYLESPEIMVMFNDILIVQRGTIGKLVHIDKQIGKATINPSMVILRVKKVISSYVYYQLVSKTGQTQILSDTSSTGVPMITQKQIEEFIVPCPSLPEQQAIAQILSDMDTEIESLEQKQAKYKAIKQGMMQELLTGKTRLV